MILTYNVLPNQKDDPDKPNGLIKRFWEKMDIQLLAS